MVLAVPVNIFVPYYIHFGNHKFSYGCPFFDIRLVAIDARLSVRTEVYRCPALA